MNPIVANINPVLADHGAAGVDGRHGGGPFGFLLFLLLILGGVALFRFIRRRRHPELYGPEAMKARFHRSNVSGAEAILAERFAKGELTGQQYADAVGVLRSEPGSGPGGAGGVGGTSSPPPADPVA